MGSLGAMLDSKESRQRYGQESADKLVPEGVEALVPIVGTVEDVLIQLVGGTQSGFGYMGAANINDLKGRVFLNRMTSEGLRESHPHDLLEMKDAPNYSRR